MKPKRLVLASTDHRYRFIYLRTSRPGFISPISVVRPRVVTRLKHYKSFINSGVVISSLISSLSFKTIF